MLIPETVDVPQKGVFAPFPTAKMHMIERKSHQSEHKVNNGDILECNVHRKVQYVLVCLLISLTMTSFVSGVSTYRSAMVSSRICFPC